MPLIIRNLFVIKTNSSFQGKQISKRKPLDDLIGSSKKECRSAKKKRKLSITHCGSEWYVSEIK